MYHRCQRASAKALSSALGRAHARRRKACGSQSPPGSSRGRRTEAHDAHYGHEVCAQRHVIRRLRVPRHEVEDDAAVEGHCGPAGEGDCAGRQGLERAAQTCAAGPQRRFQRQQCEDVHPATSECPGSAVAVLPVSPELTPVHCLVHGSGHGEQGVCPPTVQSNCDPHRPRRCAWGRDARPRR